MSAPVTRVEDLKALTDEQLVERREAAENIQKRNPPASQAWQDASAVIHACAAENQRRYSKGS
jgi:hypothetical protein